MIYSSAVCERDERPGPIFTDGKDSRVNNFNPIDKITELYERLLKEKDEKYAALERRLQNIEKSLQK